MIASSSPGSASPDALNKTCFWEAPASHPNQQSASLRLSTRHDCSLFLCSVGGAGTNASMFRHESVTVVSAGAASTSPSRMRWRSAALVLPMWGRTCGAAARVERHMFLNRRALCGDLWLQRIPGTELN